MIKIPVLAVDKDKGVLVDLELESKKGKGTLFLDIKLCPDQETRQAMNTAFSLLKIKKKDILVRIRGDKHNCLCGGSLALPVYLGMYACIRGLKFRPKTFATGGIDKKGKITSVGGLAEKIRAILGKADVLLVPKGQGLPIEGIKVKEVLDLEEAIRIALIR
jgi:predicted S18 family serine protease